MEKHTKRKSADVPLETDNISSSIVQLVHDAIIVVDEDQNIVLFNQGAEQTFGYNASEVIGQRLVVLLPPQVSDFHVAYVRSFAKAPEIARLMGERKEVSGRRKNGAIFPADVSIAKVSSGGKIFFTAILRDITERKIVEQALRQNAEKYSMLLNGVDEIIYQVNYPEGSLPHGTVEFVSEQTQEILGFRPTDFITDPDRWFNLIHPEDIPAVQAQTTKIFTSGQPGLRHYRIKDTNGEYRWMEDRVSPEKNKAGRVVRTFGVARDITERKRAEQQMKELSMAVEQTADCVVIADREGVILYVNAAFEKETGYTREEALGKTPRILKSGEHDARFYEVLWKTILAGNVFKAVFINRKKTGELVYEQKTITPLKDSQGNITHFVSTAKNTTEQVQAEKALREGEKQYRDLFESTSDLIQAVTPDGRLLFANRAWREALGYTEQELLNLNIDRVVHPEALTQCSETLQRALSGEQIDRIETRFVTKEGKSIIVEGSVTCRFEASQPIAITCFLRDITERKQAEEALRLRGSRFRALIENASDAIALISADGIILYESPAVTRVLGYAVGERTGRAFFELVHPDDLPDINNRFAHLLQQPGVTIDAQLRYRHKDGSWRWLEGVGQNLLAEPSVQAIVANYRDITERKQVEEQLQRSETRYRAIVEDQTDLVCRMLPDGTMTFVNQSCLKFFGKTLEQFIGSSIAERDIDGQSGMIKSSIAMLGPGMPIISFEEYVPQPDGSKRWVQWIERAIIEDGKVIEIQAVGRDITARKQAEDKLIRSERQLSETQSIARLGSWEWNILTNKAEWSSELYNIFGIPAESLTPNAYEGFLNYVHPLDRERFVHVMEQALATKEPFNVEYRIVRPDGVERYIHTRGRVVSDRDGLAVQMHGSLQDITERRQADEVLRQSEEKYRALVEQASDGIFVADVEGNYVEVNSRACEMLGYTRAEILRLKISDLLDPSELERAPLRLDELRQGKTLLTERTFVRKDGSIFPAEISAKMSPNGQLQAVVRDITERKQAEAERAQLLNVLEASLNEIYIFDAETLRFQYVNQGAFRNLGYTREAMSVMTPLDLKPEFDQASFRDLIIPLLRREKEKLVFQTVHRRADGSLYPVEVHLQMSDFEGKRVFHAIILDITERKRAEEALQRAEENYRNIFENSLNGIFQSTPEGRFVMVNPALARIWGFDSPEDLLTSVTDTARQVYVDPDLRARHTHLLKEQGGSVMGFEYQAYRKDGSTVWVSENVHSVVDADGALLYYEGAVEDISERKLAEQEIGKLHNAVEQSADIIFITARDGMIEYVNPAFEIVTGYSKAESIGKSPHILSSGLMEPEYYQRMWTTILSGEVFRGEVIDRKKGGEIFYYDQTITPLKDARGNITHFVSTGKDVTERKRAEEEIRQRLSELEVLYESGLAISQLLQPKEIAQKIINLLDQKLDWHHTTIRLYHPQDETLELLAFNQPGLRSEQEKRALEERFKTSIAKKGQGLSGWVVEHGQSVRTSDLMHDTRYVETFPGLQSGLYVPIIIGKQIIGVISIESEEADAFSEADERLVITLAAQAASALENARLFEETERRLEHLQSLHAIDKAITGSMDISLILDVIIGQIISQLNVDAAVILLYDQTAEALKYAKGSGFRTEALQHTRLSLGEGYAGRVALGRQMVQIPDLQTRKTDFLRSPTFSQEGFVSYVGVPLIANGEIKGVLEVFHRTAFKAETDWLNFLEALAVQTAIAIDNATLFKGLQFSNIQLTLAYDSTIEGWSLALDLRDKETEGHTLRVTEMTVWLAQAMDINESEIIHIRRGALLHDIGKMGVPDGILLKPDKLTDEEWGIMKRHPQFAYDMLSPIAYLKPALDIPYSHHEKWDGTGYPQGLKGEQIPLAARIFAMVDVYDALTSDRPYRKAWLKEKTLEYIREQSGKHFDPQLVEVFLTVVGDFKER